MTQYQKAFTEALFDRAGPPPAGLVGAPNKRFAVYRSGVWSTLTQALADAYPAVAALLGENNFRAVAAGFVENNAPKTPMLIYYGEGFAEYLETVEALRDAPYLPDLARADRCYLEAWHAADAPALSAEGFGAAVAEIDEDALSDHRLTAHPAARALQSRFPIVALFERALGKSEQNEFSGADTVLVARPDGRPFLMRAPEGTAAALVALRRSENGVAIGDLGEEVAASSGDFGAVLSTLLDGGALRSIEPPAATDED